MTNPLMLLLVSSVISQRKAIARMLDFTEEVIGGRTPVYISICHTLAEERAKDQLETACARFSPVKILLSEVSPVIGVHIGLGVLAVVYQAGVEEMSPACAVPGLFKTRQENQVCPVETRESAYG